MLGCLCKTSSARLQQRSCFGLGDIWRIAGLGSGLSIGLWASTFCRLIRVAEQSPEPASHVACVSRRPAHLTGVHQGHLDTDYKIEWRGKRKDGGACLTVACQPAHPKRVRRRPTRRKVVGCLAAPQQGKSSGKSTGVVSLSFRSRDTRDIASRLSSQLVFPKNLTG